MPIIIDCSGDIDQLQGRVDAVDLFHEKHPENALIVILPEGLEKIRLGKLDDGYVHIEVSKRPVSQTFRALKEHSNSVIVSSGNTSEVVTYAWRRAKLIHPDKFLAIITELPKIGGKLIYGDAGARITEDVEGIVWSAVLGFLVAETLYHLSPIQIRIGLLNIGEEQNKGGKILSVASSILKELFDSSYIGNVEIHDAISGKKPVDVLATYGLLGNASLKALEGGVELIRHEVSSVCSDNSWLSLYGLLFKISSKRLLRRLSWKDYNGAYLLGVKDPVIIAHGRSDSHAFYSALLKAVDPRTFAIYDSISLNNPLIKRSFSILGNPKSLLS